MVEKCDANLKIRYTALKYRGIHPFYHIRGLKASFFIPKNYLHFIKI